jgi:beta-lactamase class D
MKFTTKHFTFYILYFSFFILLNACSQNNVTVDDSLKKYFDENHVTGTFGLYDNGQGQFTIYNLSRFKDSAYLPASTFKIVNSLIGIETGTITNEKMVIPWDGIPRRPEWDKDLTMEEAFKVSAVPYYQEVARRIGKDTMQHWLDTLGYGSRYGKAIIKTSIDTFWLDNSIKITSDEQLGLVKKLYFKQLPFQGRSQDIVKRIMLQENNANYNLSYKTGWGFRENGNAIGWVVGWIEENQHPYLFVLNVEGPHNTDIAIVRMNILKGILKQLGFFEGKK